MSLKHRNIVFKQERQIINKETFLKIQQQKIQIFVITAQFEINKTKGIHILYITKMNIDIITKHIKVMLYI